MLRIAVLISVLAVSACATTSTNSASASRHDCFRALDVHGYSIIDEHRVKLRIGPSREYIVTVLQDTDDLEWANGLSVRSSTSFVCVGAPFGVELEGGNPSTRYRVTAIERFAPEATDLDN